jgi:GGDEF domain-containing protein
VKGYRVEQGDVLLSVQMLLTREEEARRRQLAQAARHAAQPPVPSPVRPPRPLPVHPTTRPASLRPLQTAPSAAPAPAAVTARARTRSAAAPVMVDPLTGIGTIHALRRDLMLEQAWPVGSPKTPALVALEIGALEQIRSDMGTEAGDQVLKCLVEVAPFALRTQDRIYRSGRNQLTVLLPGTEPDGAESARSALETALQRRLHGRGYPEVRLASSKLDPVALAS